MKYWTIVLGASEGIKVSCFEETGVAKNFAHFPIPWIENKQKELFWPIKWLENALQTIRDYVRKGDVIAPAMWGADLVFLGDNFWAYPPRHYPCVPETVMAEITEIVPATDLYLALNGANVARFQPHAQIFLEQKMRPQMFHWLCTIAPLADLITFMLRHSRRTNLGALDDFGHDPYMLQSQGLYTDTAINFHRILIGDAADYLVKGKIFAEDEVIGCDDGILLVPCSHDSIFSRLGAFDLCPDANWTGTWTGTARLVTSAVKPTAESFQAGVAFEGLGEIRAAITNIGMLGWIYKFLLKEMGLSDQYDQAQRIARTRLEAREYSVNDIATIPLQEYLQDGRDAKMAAQWVLARAKNDLGLALLWVIKTAAYECAQKVLATNEVLQLPNAQDIAIVGGWAENKLYLDCLAALDLNPKTHHFSAISTQAGLAAHAMMRVSQGKIGWKEALEILVQWDKAGRTD